ncbi:MAG: ribosome maturation factor RimP [Clostridia bacterium]|nr:ribosome maturation factor RimP [Clostridia bacterium]
MLQNLQYPVRPNQGFSGVFSSPDNMAGNNVAAQVEKLVEPLAKQQGLEIVEVEFVKEGSQYFLRVFIDKPEGITLDDCESLSRKLDPVLDQADLIPYAYRLEVSSPGLERQKKKLADFVRFQGSKAVISTFAPLNGSKKHQGVLAGADQIGVTLNTAAGELLIGWEQVAKADLEIDFEEERGDNFDSGK